MRHASYDLGCSTSENVIATPESSPNIRKGLFEDNSSRFPIIPSSPTFPAALNLSHGKVVPQKMPKQSGPVLQPAFEIKNMTTIKKSILNNLLLQEDLNHIQERTSILQMYYHKVMNQ